MLPGVMLESMLSSSMTTSMQLAEECMRQDKEMLDNTPDSPIEGLEVFAHTIEQGKHSFHTPSNPFPSSSTHNCHLWP